MGNKHLELSVQEAIEQAGLKGEFKPIPGYVDYVRTNMGVEPQGKEVAPLANYSPLVDGQPVQFPKVHIGAEKTEGIAQSVYEELFKRGAEHNKAKLYVVDDKTREITEEDIRDIPAKEKAAIAAGKPDANLSLIDTYYLSEYELSTLGLFSDLGRIANNTFASSQRSLYLFKPNGAVYWLAVEGGFSHNKLLGTNNLEGQVATLWTLIDGVPTLVDAYASYQDIENYFNKVMGESKKSHKANNDNTKDSEVALRDNYRTKAANKRKDRLDLVTKTEKISAKSSAASRDVGDLINTLGIEDADNACGKAQEYNAKLISINNRSSIAANTTLNAGTTLKDAIIRNKSEKIIEGLVGAANKSIDIANEAIAEVKTLFEDRAKEAAQTKAKAASRIQGDAEVYAELLRTAATVATNGAGKVSAQQEGNPKSAQVAANQAIKRQARVWTSQPAVTPEQGTGDLEQVSFKKRSENEAEVEKIFENSPAVNNTLWAGTGVSLVSALLLCGEYAFDTAGTSFQDASFEIEGAEMPALIILATALVLIGAFCALKTDAGRAATQNMSFSMFSFGGKSGRAPVQEEVPSDKYDCSF